MRYSIWAAVSTEQQAAVDKLSLDEQISRCRELAEGRGWLESSGPYVVPGASRTRYVNLSDAERDIPPLREMLDDARRRAFDLLMVYDLNRFRDLLPMVQKSLDAYGVQLFSLAQPVEPVDPEHYSPYASDASAIMGGMASILSRT